MALARSSLSGKLTARKLYKAEFEFEPCGKVFIAANHKPVVRGTDYAIWRRINLIPFTYTVPPDKRIPSPAEKRLIPELSGILNWALTGLQAWRETGLQPSKCVTDATDQYNGSEQCQQLEVAVSHPFLARRQTEEMVYGPKRQVTSDGADDACLCGRISLHQIERKSQPQER